MHEIKKAILDADVQDHGDKILPDVVLAKQSAPKAPEPADPYDHLADEDMPKIIPDFIHSKTVDAIGASEKKRNKKAAKHNKR